MADRRGKPPLSDRIAALPVIALIRLLQRLPRPVTLAFGRFLGWLAARLRVRRKVLVENLGIAFPDMTVSETDQLIARIYRNVGGVFGEWMVLKNHGGPIVASVEPENLQCFIDALAEGRGVLLNSAHFGNWELMSKVVRAHSPGMSIVRRRLKNTVLDALFTDLHGESGVKNLFKGESPLAIRRTLSRGEVVGMLVDQNARSPGIFVPFFGRRTSFHRGPAVLALKSGAPFVTVFLVPGETGGRRLVFDRIDATSTGDLEADTTRIMSTYAAQLESWIRRYPDQWFWFHRRWKTKPPPEISP